MNNVYRVDDFRQIRVQAETLTIEIFEDRQFVCYLNHFRDMAELRAYAKSQFNVTVR